jgi:hypothetical protein
LKKQRKKHARRNVQKEKRKTVATKKTIIATEVTELIEVIGVIEVIEETEVVIEEIEVVIEEIIIEEVIEEIKEAMARGETADTTMKPQPKRMLRSLASNLVQVVHQDSKTRRRRIRMPNKLKKV